MAVFWLNTFIMRSCLRTNQRRTEQWCHLVEWHHLSLVTTTSTSAINLSGCNSSMVVYSSSSSCSSGILLLLIIEYWLIAGYWLLSIIEYWLISGYWLVAGHCLPSCSCLFPIMPFCKKIQWEMFMRL